MLAEQAGDQDNSIVLVEEMRGENNSLLQGQVEMIENAGDRPTSA
jgi:hypothetical protein